MVGESKRCSECGHRNRTYRFTCEECGSSRLKLMSRHDADAEDRRNPPRRTSSSSSYDYGSSSSSYDYGSSWGSMGGFGGFDSGGGSSFGGGDFGGGGASGGW